MIPRSLFADEHEIFRNTVRRFIAEEIEPHHAAWEEVGVVPRELWRKAGDAGLLCPNVPAEYGGTGADFLFSTIVIEELARAGTSGPNFALHSEVVAPYLVRYGTEAQKQRWLPGMAKGEVLGCLGMTEPSGGSDLQSMRTTARREGDQYVINGSKVFITNAQHADLMVLACKTDPAQRAKGVSLILVETDRPGFKRGRLLKKIGYKASDTSELFFEDLRVPVSNLLGVEGRGFYQMMSELAQERLMQAIRAVATAEAVLQWTVDYTINRKAFGHTIADFQNTQFKLAEVHAEITVLRTFVDRCIELHLKKQLTAEDAAIAKLQTTELQGTVADRCLQFFGGWGYMWDMPVARAYADARMTRIGGGSVEVMKQIIGRSLVGGGLERGRPRGRDGTS